MKRNESEIQKRLKLINQTIVSHIKDNKTLSSSQIIDLKYQIKTLLLLMQITPESNIVINVSRLDLNNFPKYDIFDMGKKAVFLSETQSKINKIASLVNDINEETQNEPKDDYDAWLLSYLIWNFEDKNERILRGYEKTESDIENHKKDYLDHLNQLKEGVEKNNNDTNTKLTEINNAVGNIDKFRDEAKELEDRFSDVIKKMKIIEESNTFHKQARNHRNTAIIFISCFALLLLAITFYIIPKLGSISFSNIYLTLQNTLTKANTESLKTTMYFEYIKSISQKLIITSISIYTLVSLLKNYNNHMHNYITNTHKNNALNALIILYDKVSSIEAREQILLQSIQIIFTHQESGYSGTNSEAPNPNIVTNVIETLKK